MIMNKKIFTLLLGACTLAGSLFTVNAQTHYGIKDHTKADDVSFNDILTADTLKKLPANHKGYNYLLSITGLANKNGAVAQSFVDSLQTRTFVLFVDSVDDDMQYLRIENLADLDSAYTFSYNGSSKFGALRRALWCLDYEQLGVNGSNVAFDFNNMATGELLEAPFFHDGLDKWSNTTPSFSSAYYTDPINTVGEDKDALVSGWHFSQTYKSTQNLQTGMPIYSYIKTDSVLVLALNDAIPYDATRTETGGYTVTAKYVAIADLVVDAAGNINTGANGIENVLLFTLKKVNKFVLNAHDWNGIAHGLKFDPEANVTVKNQDKGNEYKNLFDSEKPFYAWEVRDSLYHYGYMQFSKNETSKDYLYVDTAWANEGNNQYLAFAWAPRRDSTANYRTIGATDMETFSGSFLWGDGFKSSITSLKGKPDSAAYQAHATKGANWSSSVYWRLDSLIWSTVKKIELAENNSFVNASGEIEAGTTGSYTLPVSDQALWDEIIDEAVALGATGLNVSSGTYVITFTSGTPLFTDGTDYIADHYNFIYTKNIAMRDQFHKDSMQYIYTFYADSLMENQSKFRVVYDPFADSTYINAYQTRVAHPNYEDGVANQTWPYWWENSFVIDRFDDPVYFSGVWMPHFTSTSYSATGKYLEIQGNVQQLYGVNSQRNPISNASNGSPAYIWHGYRSHKDSVLKYPHDAHSFMLSYEKSRYSKMDVVMISTADTMPIYNEFNSGDISAMAHMYGYSVRENQNESPFYKDSLFYVDLQSLTGGNNKMILTLDQLYKDGKPELDTKISINYGPRCEDTKDEGKATIGNDLYLIRNEHGEYLTVPLWSLMDSVAWTTPAANEDPRRMPCYQWAVVNIRNTEHSPFRLINREFENVEYPYTYVYESNDHEFVLAGGVHLSPKFNKHVVYSGVTTEEQALNYPDDRISAATFSDDVEKIFPLSKKISFIRLGKTVKEDQLIGYKYVDPDSTVVDVYALKYLHGLAMGDNARYLGWYGDDDERTPRDTAVYAHFQSYYDKTYFDLQEMTFEESYDSNKDKIYGNGHIFLTKNVEKNGKHDNSAYHELYTELYKQLTARHNNYTNRDSIVLERFGFYLEKDGESVIPGLKPMARQAYRLMLQDYYRWHPTVKGHYMVVGEQDNYILADRAQAVKKYVSGSGNVEGLFGIPHFYFRNTYFDVQYPTDDYFAMIQRLDTLRNDLPDYEYASPTDNYADIREYLTITFGSEVADAITIQIRRNNEFGVFAAIVEDAFAPLKMVVRGEGTKAVSTFQLERDSDPIYRRFHGNEPSGNFYPERGDYPDTLEFHVLNDGELGYRLYENSGNYKDEDQADRFGLSGGRVYNRENDGNGDYYRDSLNHVISFLGINRNTQYGKNTNYAIYVDTAYINRGTGWIKPQYMLVVDPFIPEECGTCNPATGNDEGANEDYVIGRYLFNTAQYAKAVKDVVYDDDYNEFNVDKADAIELPIEGTSTKKKGYYIKSDNYNKVEPIDTRVIRKPYGKSYLRNTEWERLAFSWAIHKDDTLYILKGVDLEPIYNNNFVNDPKDVWQKLTEEYGAAGKYVDFEKLKRESRKGDPYYEAYYPSGNRGTGEMREYYNYKTVDELKAAGKTIGLHAMVRLDDNTHKDWVFSMRYIERRSDDFVIESETTDRDTRSGAVIRPGYGGWVKFDNEVPYITRSDAKVLQIESFGAVFNVNPLRDQAPVNNETIGTDASDVNVISGTGAVTILNAIGKKVVISNILGQTVANVTLNSDNASVTVPAGVVVVAVEGEKAVKAVVK